MKRITKRSVAMILIALMIVTMSLFAAADVGVPASVSGQTAPWENEMSIMSFNVLDYNTTQDEYASPAQRAAATVGMILEYQPDIIGIQEACQGCSENGYFDWNAYLSKNLRDVYACRRLTEEDGMSTSISRGLMIFYKADRFERMDSGAYHYASDSKRSFQWIKLADRQADNQPVFIYNTHLAINSSGGQTTRPQQLADLWAHVQANASGVPCFATGDFNCNFSGGTWDCGALTDFTGYSFFADAGYTAAKNTVAESYIRSRLDHVFYNKNLTDALEYVMINSADYTPRLSDHHAIILRCRRKAPAGLTVSIPNNETDVYYQDGTYYVNCLTKNQAAVTANVSVSGGTLYSDEGCNTLAGTSLQLKLESNNTYLADNTYYIKVNENVYPVTFRIWNANANAKTLYVDKSFISKSAGDTALYSDRWYCRKVTVGTNGFATIQEAVDHATDGYEIYVAPGHYVEDINYTNKNLKLYGGNRNNAKALKAGGDKWVINSAHRMYETYLEGSITFVDNNYANASIMVNGFYFMGKATVGQVRVVGGTETASVSMEICHNIFNCYTDGSTFNGAAIHGNTRLQKNAKIYDNYFHLADTPSYKKANGSTGYFVNRSITMRNLKAVEITDNWFDGYSYNMLYLASEVSDGAIEGGYGNLKFNNNLITNCRNMMIWINNITEQTNANLQIGDNVFLNSEKIAVYFRDTKNQTNNGLTNAKQNISVSIKNSDKVGLNLHDTTGINITYHD